MATQSHISVFDESLHRTHDWLRELELLAGLDNQAQAYSILREVLHALRDRLSPDEAADLASELPMIVRGFYYEGYQPSKTPTKHRTREAFFNTLREQTRRINTLDPGVAVGCVFKLLSHRISEGEINDIRHVLPKELREMWPRP